MMEEVKIASRAQVKLIWEGQDYLLKKPTMGMSLEMERAMKDSEALGGKGSSEIVLKFIGDCGLPLEIARDIPVEGIDQLVSALMPKKKQ